MAGLAPRAVTDYSRPPGGARVFQQRYSAPPEIRVRSTAGARGATARVTSPASVVVRVRRTDRSSDDYGAQRRSYAYRIYARD